MIVTHKIKMDLTQHMPMPCIDAVQNDSCSRKIQISLFTNGIPFMLPEGSRVQIRYCKEDGIGGKYDTMPDDSRAWEIYENNVTIKLAPQVCTSSGNTALTVVLLHEATVLHCFEVQLRVQPVQQPRLQSLPYDNVRYSPQGDWNAEQNEAGHILNRTHWTETVVVDPVFDGDLTGRETVLIQEGVYAVKVSPEYVSVEGMIGSDMVFYADGMENTMTLTADMVMDASTILGVSASLVVAHDMDVISCPADVEIEGLTFSAGTWVLCVPGDYYIRSLSCLKQYKAEVVHKIDRKYLPDDVGGAGCFAVSITADENGVYAADKTIAELDEAYFNGRVLVCVNEQACVYLQLAYAVPSQAYLFSGIQSQSSEEAFKTSQAIIAAEEGDTYVQYSETEGITQDAIPTHLPNPNKICFRNTLASVVRPNVSTATIAHHYYDGTAYMYVFGIPCPYSLKLTGAVTAEYDGSQEVTVEIPSGINGLPVVSDENNGAFLRVVDGSWTAVSMTNAEEVEF